MKTAIMQPYLFPYIGYFQLINAVDKFIFFDDVQWMKGGWINRHAVLKNSKEGLLTLSILKHSYKSKINEVLIRPDEHGKEAYIAKLRSYYCKAPYFEQTYKIVENIFNYENDNIAQFIYNSFIELDKILNINTEFILSSNLDYNRDLHAEGKVLDICKRLKTDVYINTVRGQHLYNKEEFKRDGIELLFLDREIDEYNQFENKFVPYLSIIDLMMFNPIEKVQEMIKKGSLV